MKYYSNKLICFMPCFLKIILALLNVACLFYFGVNIWIYVVILYFVLIMSIDHFAMRFIGCIEINDHHIKLVAPLLKGYTIIWEDVIEVGIVTHKSQSGENAWIYFSKIPCFNDIRTHIQNVPQSRTFLKVRFSSGLLSEVKKYYQGKIIDI